MKGVERRYRTLGAGTERLCSYGVRVKETDLWIRSGKPLAEQARDLVYRARAWIEAYIELHPEFVESLEPLPPDPYAPDIVQEMIRAAGKAGVGPMAAVAGAVAEYVGRGLVESDPNVLVENGGDVFVASEDTVIVGIFAGASPLNLKVGVRVPPEKTPLGVCTSSGTIGHSLSLGRADAAVVVSGSASLADAAATALGNRVSRAGEIPRALEWVRGIEEVWGAMVIFGDRLGVWGDLDLVALE